MTSRLTIKPEDVELFRRTMGDVVPLRHNSAELPAHRRRHPPRRPPSNAAQRDFTDAPFTESMHVSAEDGIEFRKTGVQDRVFRRLRQGRFDLAGQLDLHGMTLAHARSAFAGFMSREGHSRRQRCVRIIHGKGLRSKEGPVIKRQIQAWLQAHPDVLAYCSCRPADGGTGALYVLLKSTHG